MLSAVFLYGTIKDSPKEGVRYVELLRPVPNQDGIFQTDLIPVKTAFGTGRLLSLPYGSTIAIKGRLETDPDLGLVVIDELDEVSALPKKEKKMIKWLRVVFFAVPRILWDFMFLWPYARHPEKYSLSKRYERVRNLVMAILRWFHVDLKLYGYENYENLVGNGESFLVAANHLSDLDPLIIIALSPKPISFVAKKETLKYPFIRTIIKAMEGFFLDRENLREGLKTVRALEERLRKNDLSYIIFPEGTRNKNPEEGLLPFHPGSFKGATLSKSPIVPVSVWGTQAILSTSTSHRRYPVELTFFEPLMPSTYEKVETTVLASKVETMMKESLVGMQGEERAFYEKGLHKAKWRKGQKVR